VARYRAAAARLIAQPPATSAGQPNSLEAPISARANAPVPVGAR
jgi:hypothetical protein